MAKLKEKVKSGLARLAGPLLSRHRAAADLADKCSYATKVAQRSLFVRYREMVEAGRIPRLEDAGYRVFSEADEDGILLLIFAAIGAPHKTFVDIGSGDGVNSNCANLAVHFGWHGLFIDGSPDRIGRGEQFYREHQDTKTYPPKFVCAVVNRENVNGCIAGAGFSGEVDLLSIDIDGNDYWIWDALECISPRVVCIETHVEFGSHDVVVPYDEHFVRKESCPDYFGASPVAMVKLAGRKGYRLVGANHYGYNTFYVRNDVGRDLLPEVPPAAVLRHPGHAEWVKRFDPIKDMPFVAG